MPLKVMQGEQVWRNFKFLNLLSSRWRKSPNFLLHCITQAPLRFARLQKDGMPSGKTVEKIACLTSTK